MLIPVCTYLTTFFRCSRLRWAAAAAAARRVRTYVLARCVFLSVFRSDEYGTATILSVGNTYANVCQSELNVPRNE